MKSGMIHIHQHFVMSPSMRREWIEISIRENSSPGGGSPSMRREWIEMIFLSTDQTLEMGLPPCGGSGLKCILNSTAHKCYYRLPPCGGSGLKCWVAAPGRSGNESLPPCGGSGLKYLSAKLTVSNRMSPSMRREWIEIFARCSLSSSCPSPSMRREWIEIS